MTRACLCMLAGVYALQLNSFAAESDPIAITLVALFALAWCRPGSCTFWFFTGLALFSWQAHSVIESRLNPLYAGDSMVGQVRVVDFPERRDARVTMTVVPLEDGRLPSRMRISWYQPALVPKIGDVWQFELRLRRPRGYANPGTFDFEAWLFRQGIGATGYVVAGPRNRLLQWDVLGPVDRLRRHVVDRLVDVLPGVEDAAILAAIAVGARHLMSAAQWQTYARTGTSHLMAISGLHVGLVAGGGYVLGWILGAPFWGRCSHGRVALLTAMGSALAFTLISGLAVPGQRAASMIVLFAAATLRMRVPAPWQALAGAAVLVIIVRPLVTMAPGFRLSFAAVAVLLWTARGEATTRIHRSPIRALRQLGKLQCCLLLGLLPFTVAIFGRAVLSAPAVNLLVLPLFSTITVPCTLLGLLFDGPLQGMGNTFLAVAASSLHGIDWLLGQAMRVPGTAMDIPVLGAADGLLLLVPLVWLLLPPGWPGRRLGWLGLFALMLCQPPRPQHGCIEVTLLDVGQGLALVARSRRHTLLYDTGPAFRGGGSTAATVILPYLRSRAITYIDTLIVSHADLDHAGGLAAILGELPVRRILAGDGLAQELPRAQACHAGEKWSVDGVDFEILHPATGSSLEGNDSSCVLQVATGKYLLWITGDIEAEAETELLGRVQPDPAAVVVVPHHGSRSSSTMPFVNALRPGLALVSAGYDNRWGLPKKAVTQRWRNSGAGILNTATAGAVAVKMCRASGVETDGGFRRAQRRIWTE